MKDVQFGVLLSNLFVATSFLVTDYVAQLACLICAAVWLLYSCIIMVFGQFKNSKVEA